MFLGFLRYKFKEENHLVACGKIDHSNWMTCHAIVIIQHDSTICSRCKFLHFTAILIIYVRYLCHPVWNIYRT